MKSFSSFLWVVSKPFKRYIFGLLGVALGWSIVVNIQPYLIKLIIDKVSLHKGQDLFNEVYPLVLAHICVGVGFFILFRYYDYIIAVFIPKQKEFIVLKLMKRMMHHSTSFYQRHLVGNLANKVNDVTIHIPELIKIITDNFATCICTLLIVLYNMSLIHPKFAWALIIWLSWFMGVSLWLLFSHTHLVDASAETRSQVIGHIVDMLVNMTSIRLFARAPYEISVMNKVTSQAAQKEYERDRFFMKLHFLQSFSFWTFEAICFWWLLLGISKGTITPGGFVLIFTLNLQILDQFWGLGKEIRQFWEKMGHMQQALRLIYADDDLPSLPYAEPLKVVKGRIVFDHVHFFYDGSAPLFENKTVDIAGGQKVGLVGYSGSGKSTFISLILRLYTINSGKILIDDQNIQEINRESLYQSIAIIPQDCYLFNRPMIENIRYGKLEATEEEIYEAARKAQIHDIIEQMPQGYQTFAGEKGMRLSGGQRQRVAIARAILKNAPILILDEATSHLDVLTEEKLKAVFDVLMENKTVFVIAHRLSTLKSMDRLLVFDKGKIIQDGSHSELITIPGLYRDLWFTQSHGMLSSEKPVN